MTKITAAGSLKSLERILSLDSVFGSRHFLPLCHYLLQSFELFESSDDVDDVSANERLSSGQTDFLDALVDEDGGQLDW